MKKVTVVGIGRLGICMALVFEHHGYDVVGVDVFPSYVDQINRKQLQSTEPRVMEFLQKSKNLRATLSLDEGLEHSDVIMIAVATPSTGGDRHYDISTLSRILSQINARKVKNKHVVVTCTVLPGYCRQIGMHLLRDCENTTLSYNPEFIAQGDIINGLLKPDMVLIGEGSKEAGALLEDIYVSSVENTPRICRMSTDSAEITKLAVNCFVTMKISYANMIGDCADRTPNAEKYTILKAIGSDSRVGGKYLRPGYGFGGPCFPRDNRALGSYMQSVGVKPLLPLATDEYNVLHGKYQTEALLKEGKDVYVMDDVAYKECCPVPIIEESQKLVIAKNLVDAGKRVIIRDRDFIVACVEREFGSIFEYEITNN
eukprot:CAMPEP_0113878472 /NCGR_PEP_ID=MMETSP0780_2-20120614/6706_1 /TAXON_ID=652834 /ORGANISM="Palpitomonas bilix" /LENGTH=370 /DNA_ID=CAMNT_0000864955 /DNA_START=44 /DNA_END=1156 /DNA_ORIENTATION=- /assembly_acc=CAM_ASM_000599